MPKAQDKNRKKNIFNFIKNTKDSVSWLLQRLRLRAKKVRQILVASKQDKDFMAFVKKRIAAQKGFDRTTRNYAVEFIMELKRTFGLTVVKARLSDNLEVRAILDSAYKERITNEDGFEQSENKKKLEEKAKMCIIVEESYQKGMARLAQKALVQRFKQKKISFEDAVADLDDPAKIKDMLERAEKEITFRQSSTGTSLRNNVIGGVLSRVTPAKAGAQSQAEQWLFLWS